MNRRAGKLHEALVSGSMESAEKLLLRGVLLDGDFRLAHQELEAMDIGGLRLLVEHGYDLSVWLTEQPGPAVRALLYSGLINTPCANIDGRLEPALHFAIASGDNPLMAVLITCGADVDHPDGNGRTPLFTAISYNRLEAVRMLLRHGAKPILYRYCVFNPEESLCRLLGIASASMLPLVFAAGVRDDEGMVGELLAVVDAPNARDDAGNTALHAAVQDGCAGNVRALLADARVDPNVRDADQKTPYDLADTQEIRNMLTRAGSQLPPGHRPHGFLSMAALRCASCLRGVVFPFGFGPGETFAHADLRDCDLSRAALSLNQIDQLKSLEGIRLPAGTGLPGPDPTPCCIPEAQRSSLLPELDPVDAYGLTYRHLRAAGRTIRYRRVHRLEHLGDGPGLENVDLRPIANVMTPEVLRRYEWFSGVIFPRGLDLAALDRRFFEEREFFCCDFSETVNFPAYAWSVAGAMRAARCPPGVDFQQADFRDIDLTDTDFSLQIPLIWIEA